MTADDKAELDSQREPVSRPVAPVGTDAEQRTLTTEEFRQLDTMLGGSDFPTVIRPKEQAPPAHRAGVLQTLIVAMILAAIVGLALYLFR